MEKHEKIRKLTKKQVEAVKGGVMSQYAQLGQTGTKNAVEPPHRR